METIFQQMSEAMASAVEKTAASVVLVNGRRRMPASGVAYKPNLILTADHVLEVDEDVTVHLPDGTEVTAQVAGRDASSDLALLRLEDDLLTPAKAAGNDLKVGELVLALGRPRLSGIQASLGVVSAVNGPVRTRRGGMLDAFIRTDALPLPGFSGGALINSSGEVIGVNTSGLGHGALLTIPMAQAAKIADTLEEFGGMRRGFLGIRSQTVELPESGVKALGREQSHGLLLVAIEEDTPAAESNLMVGDILVGLAGEVIANHDDLFALLVGEIVGQETAVQVLRGGELKEVKVAVGERTEQTEKRHRRGRRGRSDRHSKRRSGRHHG